MISKREWYAALRRMLKRAALWFGGLFLMTALSTCAFGDCRWTRQ